MRRKLLAIVGLLVAGVGTCQAGALIPQTTAARYGLTRAWYSQISSPRIGGEIKHISQDRGTLFVQTSQGILNAVDAETGGTLWAMQVGPRHHLSTEPAANEKYVAVVNGSVLYVLDRSNGDTLWQKQLGGGTGAGPAVSATHAFVPMSNGTIEGYDLAVGAKQQPWIYKSAGRLSMPPMATSQTVSWTTDKGWFYVADPEARGIRYRLESRAAIQSRPGYWTPNLYASSSDGYVYAVNERAGQISWKFSLGDAVYESPVAIDDRVYVISEFGHMYCLDGKTGQSLWHAPKMRQFVAASPQRLYVTDTTNRLKILDNRTGFTLASLPLDDITIRVCNSQTDRIFLANEAGVVQCFHEVELKTPTVHIPPSVALPEVKGQDKEKPPKSDSTAPADDEAEAAAAEALSEEGDEPAMDAMDEEKPEEPAAEDAEEDPFK